MRPDRYTHALTRGRLAGAALLVALGALVFGASIAPAQDLQGQVDGKRQALDAAKQEEGVLTSEIQGLSKSISRLEGEVATLRNREAIVAAELAETEARLAAAKEELERLRKELRRSIAILADRLVAIYKSDEPDALTVVLEADGFEDLLERSEYLSRIESQDEAIVERVRELRDETKATVQQVREARNVIAAKQAELQRTRAQLESREAALSTARSQKGAALDGVKGHIDRLEGDIADLEGEIQAELAAAASAPEAPPATLPAGPVQGGSGGFIWPVSGTVTSPFGQRWGRLHAGIDIAVSAGTPIRAVKSGSIALAAPYGGYGNYTCINHGGGLSSCYAHQSSFAITSGSVSQGDVIGYVGCTGSCFGDHLHFEIRINGSPVDPMGYL